MPFNFTAAAVALPAIGQSFHGSTMAVNWVANAFMLTFGSCLMLAGALADSYGRKRMFAGGIAAFALLSAALLAAPNLFVFDLLRGAQGVAAAIAFSGGMSALAQVYDGPARMRAFSFVGCSFGIGLAFGPVAAAVMIDLFNWSIVFILLTLVAGIACFLACRYMPESRNPAANGIDWAGAVVFTWTLGVFTYAVLRVPEVGWGDAFNLALFAVAMISLLVFIRIELRVQQPMLDLTLFKFPRFVGVQLLAAAPAYSFVVLLLLLPLRFVGVEGMPVLEAGRLMIALSAPLLFLPIIAGSLTRWFSAIIVAESRAGRGICLAICVADVDYRLRDKPALGINGWPGGKRGASRKGGAARGDLSDDCRQLRRGVQRPAAAVDEHHLAGRAGGVFISRQRTSRGRNPATSDGELIAISSQ
ncbi:putative MFS-type transporter [Beauveria bassiana D1-5]|uniref:Putative MFS-type transporter n=1 Tax=Beauveria bassiana D1-5 TaxID=1245745 RepID=A0A0A2WJG5_BEABA|nr:putative MFS-type transporter [Beauveria bassiana D1-5]